MKWNWFWLRKENSTFWIRLRDKVQTIKIFSFYWFLVSSNFTSKSFISPNIFLSCQSSIGSISAINLWVNHVSWFTVILNWFIVDQHLANIFNWNNLTFFDDMQVNKQRYQKNHSDDESNVDHLAVTRDEGENLLDPTYLFSLDVDHLRFRTSSIDWRWWLAPMYIISQLVSLRLLSFLFQLVSVNHHFV